MWEVEMESGARWRGEMGENEEGRRQEINYNHHHTREKEEEEKAEN